MKNILIILLFLFVYQGFAQEENGVRKKWYFGLEASSFRSFRSLSGNSSTELVKNLRNGSEKPSVGFRIGPEIEYFLNTKLSLSSGIKFSNNQYRTNTTTLHWSDENQTQSSAFVSYSYQYFEIPLKAKYTFHSSNNIDFFISGGLISNYLMAYQIHKHEEKNAVWTKSSKTYPDKSFTMFQIAFQPGIRFRTNRSFQFQISIFHQHGISAVNPNYSLKEYLYSTGISFITFI
jgi:hypothetical protein